MSEKQKIVLGGYCHKYEAIGYAIKHKAIRENMLKICQDESKSDSEVMESIVKISAWIQADDVSAFFRGDIGLEGDLSE